jgi:hypothetical protein
MTIKSVDEMLAERQAEIDQLQQALDIIKSIANTPSSDYDYLREAYISLLSAKARLEFIANDQAQYAETYKNKIHK